MGMNNKMLLASTAQLGHSERIDDYIFQQEEAVNGTIE